MAEHEYGVAILASEIAQRMGLAPCVVASVAGAALVHDADEVRGGDIPTPTKKRIRQHFGDDAFDVALGEFALPHIANLPPIIRTIIKCADYLESMYFLSEHKVGRHADAVMDDIIRDADAYFSKAGEPGLVAAKLWSELQNAVYEI